MEINLHKLTETLQNYEAGKVFPADAARELVRLFDQMNRKAEKISTDKKEEFAAEFIDTVQKLVALINPYIEVISLSEESLLSSLDNPSYFDADQWNAVQEAKQQLAEIAEQLLPHLATVPEIEGEMPQQIKGAKKHPPRAPRSKWMKS
jgi:outer membrane protein OmpA-like peptidoglycan-associated protein